VICITNGGGEHPARNIVSTEFLDLVRYGVRDALDPLIVDSVAVIDSVLKRDLPQGASWRRYNQDGYGPKSDGGPFDGTGVGRCWPLLGGERGHYELAAGRDPKPYILALEKFSNEGNMLPEQVWDDPDLPEAHMFAGQQAGSAMPLCWAHAEYIMLARSRRDGAVYECVPQVRERYAKKRTPNRVEIWTVAHQSPKIRQGKVLRLIFSEPVVVRWSFDDWKTVQESESTPAVLRCSAVDLPTDKLAKGSVIKFTFRHGDAWEGKDFVVLVT
jgi:glucoamylase